MIKTIIGISILIGFYLFHRFCLWLESNGWIYYIHKRAESSALGNSLQELNALLNPSVRHTITMKQNQIIAHKRTEKN